MSITLFSYDWRKCHLVQMLINALALVPEIDQEEGPTFDFSILRLSLKDDASKNLDLDISFVMDCCYTQQSEGGAARQQQE